MKITFLLTNPPNPRMQRRAVAFSDFAECSLSCIRRENTNVYEYEKGLYSYVDETSMEVPPSTHFFKRLRMLPAIKKKQLESLEKIKPDVIYLQGLDCLMAASEYKHSIDGKVRIVYEVADLREALFRGKSIFENVKNRAVQKWEERHLEDVSLLVATSDKFLDLRYKALLPEGKTIVVPNIPSPEPFKKYSRKDSGDFVVGYVGVVRYLDQMRMLANAAKKAGVKVHFAGGGDNTLAFEAFKRECDALGNVVFTGRYNYAKDIAKIYGFFDCVYAVYDSANPNVRIALPNKLYEAIFCELPLIVSKGTYLGEIVESLGVGICVNSDSIEEIEEAVSMMSSRGHEYYKMVDACRRAKTGSLMNDGIDDLSTRLKAI